MTYLEKAAYLKGISEGIGMDEKTKEGKLTLGIIDALSDIAQSLSSLENMMSSLESEIEDISEELSRLSDFVYDGDNHSPAAECPFCGQIITIDNKALEEGFLVCPGCSEQLELDFDCGCGEDCDCDDDCDCGGISHIHGGPQKDEEN